MIRKTAVVMLCCVIFNAISTRLLAQDYGDNRESKGPVRMSVRTYGEYTDNRDSTADGDSTFDFYIQPRLDLESSWADKDGRMVFYYMPSYRWRSDPNSLQNENEWFHDVGVDVNHKAGGVSLRLNELFNYTDDPAVQDGGRTLRSDASFIYNRVAAGAMMDFGRVALADIYGQHRIKRYDKKEVADESDEDSLLGGVYLMGKLGGKNSTIGIGAEAGAQDYSSAKGVERGFTSAKFVAGMDNVHANLRTRLRAGIQTVEYDDEALGSDELPSASASIEYIQTPEREMPGNRFALSASYGLRESDVYPFAAQKTTALSALWDMEVVPGSVMLTLSASCRLGEYEREALPAGGVTDPDTGAPRAVGDETTVVGSLEVVYKVNDNTSVRAAQVYEDVDSDVRPSFTKNTTRLALWYEF